MAAQNSTLDITHKKMFFNLVVTQCKLDDVHVRPVTVFSCTKVKWSENIDAFQRPAFSFFIQSSCSIYVRGLRSGNQYYGGPTPESTSLLLSAGG